MIKLVILFVTLAAASVNTQSVAPAAAAPAPTATAAPVDEIPEVLLVGGLFETGSEHVENAFMEAFDAANTDRKLGKRRLKGKVEQLELADSFQASQSVCSLLSAGVLALYGPQSLQSTSHVQSMAASMEIPHLEARIDFKPPGNHSVNVMPSPYVLARAFRDLASKRNWQSYAIVYGNDEALIRIQEFVRDENLKGVPMIFRRTDGENNKAILADIRATGTRNIILDLSIRDSLFAKFMEAAQQEGMMSEYYSYITTSLDLEQAEIPPVAASISSFSLIEKPGTTFSVATALTHDAILLLTESLAELLKTKPLEKHSLSCELHDSWPYGGEIRKQLLKTNVTGMTGELKFDESGIRSDFKLRILENMGEKGSMKSVGTWTPAEGIRIDDDNLNDRQSRYRQMLEQKTIRVLRVANGEPWDGFLSDVLSELQKHLGFNVTTEFETHYGAQGSDGKWKGIVRRLQDSSADISLADLTITDTRKQVMDFTTPLLTVGTTVLIKKSDAGNMTSAQDLLKQESVSYGALMNGATAEFLVTSNDTTFQQMYQEMENTCPKLFVKTVSEGVSKVKSGGFAMFIESLQAEYEINRSCDLQQLGGLLNVRGYGIGLPKRSPYRKLFSSVIEEMEESGKIQQLKDKHWQKNPALDCNKEP